MRMNRLAEHIFMTDFVPRLILTQRKKAIQNGLHLKMQPNQSSKLINKNSQIYKEIFCSLHQGQFVQKLVNANSD